MPVVAHVMDPQGYRQLSDLAAIEAALARPDATVWIDSDEKTCGIEDWLEQTLKLHPLVIEDIYSDRLTPKVEDYGAFIYIVMHGVRRDGETPEAVSTLELDVVLGTNWVFTHHAGPFRAVDDLSTELKRNPRPLTRGAAFLAHALIDRLTDFYLPVVDRFDDEIDALETDVVESPAPEMLPRIFALKRSLQRLRRLSAYQRDVLQRLSRGEFDLIPPAALPFYRDVYDHFVRISDLADSYRDMVAASLEIYMSVTANRTNDIMKVLAIISTVMLPLTFIAGVYGMNFEHMPELHWRYGYPAALAMMAAVTALLVIWFRRRGWIGPLRRRPVATGGRPAALRRPPEPPPPQRQ